MFTHGMELVPVPLDELTQHPENANNGDVDALEESIEVNGFYAPLIVQRSTGNILAGNHRYLVAMKRGITELPVVYLDVDDEHAKRIMLADNRVTRLGIDDESMLSALLQDLYATDLALSGTGYDTDDLNRLLDGLSDPLTFEETDDADATNTDSATTTDELPFTVTLLVDADGDCYELAVEKEGLEKMTRRDVNQVRKALGKKPLTQTEINAYGVRGWKK